ncbi:MAG: response regulator [Acidobacteria bacterium]|nr:response regulator [Acidobacteriota bacterium]
MEETKILIIEDERHITKFLEFILVKEGCRILCASDGRAALETLKTFEPDAILLDLGLPDMSGIDLLREIRADKTHQDAKVIVLSATLYEGISDQLSAAGADAQCSKPIAPTTLVRTLQNLNLLRPHNLN